MTANRLKRPRDPVKLNKGDILTCERLANHNFCELSRVALTFPPNSHIWSIPTRRQHAVGSKAALRSGLCFMWITSMNTYVYIDGFNLYYGALKGTRYKWLDLKVLMSRVLPQSHNIIKIKYFTARVSGAADPDAPRRQAIYFKAMKTLREIEIHFGNFLSKTMWRPIINLPIANRNIHLSSPIKIPRGDYGVDGSIFQTLPIGDYPLKGVKYGGPHVKPLSNAIVAHVHTMEEKGSDVNFGNPFY